MQEQQVAVNQEGSVLQHQASAADIAAELKTASQLMHHQSLQQAQLLQVCAELLLVASNQTNKSSSASKVL